MQKTNIEWTDYSWNPLIGICPVNCKTPDGKEYCYARKMYKRFHWNEKIRFNRENPFFYTNIKKPSKIFTCSTFEIFHPLVNKSWRDEKLYHTFQILTKMPENIDRPMPDNVWLGVSITDGMNMWRWPEIKDNVVAKVKFVSHEPVIEEIPFYPKECDWFIIGRLTSFGKKFDPSYTYIKNLLNGSRMNRTPIFMKDNLKDIWGEDLIQEFPE